MKNLLLPTDYSSNAVNALAYALNFAKEIGASVNIFNVASNPPFDSLSNLKTPISELSTDQLPTSKLTNFVKRAIDSKALGAPESNPIGFELGTGFAAPEIRARSKDYDYIIMGKKGENSIGEKLFGGVTTSVIATADCPVLTVPEKARYKDIDNILFAIDYNSITTTSVNSMIDIAEQLNATLHFVHVSTNTEEDQNITEDLLEEILTMSKIPQIAFEVVILKRAGNTNKTLEQFVKDKSIDLICMVRGDKGIFKKLFLESHTRSMCYSTEIPLLSFPGRDNV